MPAFELEILFSPYEMQAMAESKEIEIWKGGWVKGWNLLGEIVCSIANVDEHLSSEFGARASLGEEFGLLHLIHSTCILT